MPPKTPKKKSTRSETSWSISDLFDLDSPPDTKSARRRARQKANKASKITNSPKQPVNSPGSESGITYSNVVTQTKKKESESEASSEEDKDNSTGELKEEEESQSSTREKEPENEESENEDSEDSEDKKVPTPQAKMGSNATPFDAKLEHVLVNYFSALGANNEF